MARIRTVKPEFWEDEIVGQISREARLLFIGTWTLADDAGRLRWSPAYIRAALFMYDELPLAEVAQLMREVVDAGLVAPYEVRGERLALVCNFGKHQRIDKPSPPKLPSPDLQVDSDSRGFVEDSGRDQGGGQEGSRWEGKGRERDPGSLTSDHSLANDQDPNRDLNDQDRPPPGEAARSVRKIAGLATGEAWNDRACQTAVTKAAALHPERPAAQIHDAFVAHACWTNTISPMRFPHVVDQALRELKLDPELNGDHRPRDGPIRSRKTKTAHQS